jgi:hypothetical protein
MNKLVVYVVTFELNDTYEIMGIFSTKEKAQTYIDNLQYPRYHFISPFTIDENVE